MNANATAGWSLHRGLVVLGFLAALAGFLTATGGDLAFMLTPEVAPFLVFVSLGAVFTGLLAVRESRATLLAAGLVVAFPGLLVNVVFGGAFELASPLGGGPFAAFHLLALATMLALPAAVLGARGLRRGAPLPRLRDGLATWHGIAAVVVASASLSAAAIGGIAAGEAAELLDGGGTALDFEPDARLRVAAEGFAFPEAPLQVPAGGVVEVVVENRDAAFHTFTYLVDGQVRNHDILGGAEAHFLLRLDAPGTLQYWCEPHSSGPEGQRTGMVGTLQVV